MQKTFLEFSAVKEKAKIDSLLSEIFFEMDGDWCAEVTPIILNNPSSSDEVVLNEIWSFFKGKKGQEEGQYAEKIRPMAMEKLKFAKGEFQKYLQNFGVELTRKASEADDPMLFNIVKALVNRLIMATQSWNPKIVFDDNGKAYQDYDTHRERHRHDQLDQNINSLKQQTGYNDYDHDKAISDLEKRIGMGNQAAAQPFQVFT